MNYKGSGGRAERLPLFTVFAPDLPVIFWGSDTPPVGQSHGVKWLTNKDSVK